MARKSPQKTSTVDVLGNTWTARHLIQSLLAEESVRVQVRAWNEGPSETSAELVPGSESLPKIKIVPAFLKDHKGLGFRSETEQIYIHHHRRRRDLWTHPAETAANLDCCPEVMAVLHDLVFFNSYGAPVLAGQKLKNINYDWQRRYENFDLYRPHNVVLASKPSIERVWDNNLVHAGAQLNYHSPVKVESIRAPTSADSLALILSPPHGIMDDTEHVVVASRPTAAPSTFYGHSWLWKSFQSIVSRELIASLPRFFIWIDENRGGGDFLETGLLEDGAILRVLSVPLPHNDDKILVQVDRISTLGSTPATDDFFAGSPWAALVSAPWQPLPSELPDELIFGAVRDPKEVVRTVLRHPIAALGVSPSGLNHHTISHGFKSNTGPLALSR